MLAIIKHVQGAQSKLKSLRNDSEENNQWNIVMKSKCVHMHSLVTLFAYCMCTCMMRRWWDWVL